MIEARKMIKGAFTMLIPRTSAKMRQNDVFRWTNCVIWVAIILMALIAVFFQTSVKN
jgi:hypothetical protein